MGQTVFNILFDCDNTLVETEHLAFQACARLANEILAEHRVLRNGQPIVFTGPGLMAQYVGKNFRGMMEGLQKDYKFSMSEEELTQYVDREVGEVIASIEHPETGAKECEGATRELEILQRRGFKMCVVSSSAGPRVEASVKKVGQDKFFPPNKIFSAATSLPKPTSKPNPAVYLFAMEKMGYEVKKCIAIEDSASGAGAAIAAKIRTIAYVGAYPEAERDEKAIMLLGLGCVHRMDHWSQFPLILEKLEKNEVCGASCDCAIS